MEHQTRNDPTVIFVLGLLSVITCQILGPVAWYMGTAYKAECMALEIEPQGLGKAGYILGIIGTVFLALTLLYILVMVPLFIVLTSI
ncbi:MAG: DUF4190 domain-containing protein [Myxococcota bacterium]